MLCVAVHDRAGFNKKRKECPQNGANGPKIGFLGFIGNLVITFSRIWSLKKVHTICRITALIPYLGKILFQNEPKCSWPIRLQYF